jgi:hypothetical protein
MSSKLREKILGAPDIKKELVRVDEWDVTVEVRTLTGAQMFEVKKGSSEIRKNEEEEDVEVQDQAKLYAALLIASVFDPETGAPVFEAADRDAIIAKSFAVLDKVVTVAMRICGLTKPEQKAMEKNSAATPSVATASA